MQYRSRVDINGSDQVGGGIGIGGGAAATVTIGYSKKIFGFDVHRMINTIFPLLFSLLILLAIIEVAGYLRLIGILKSKHTQVWQSLGGPTLIKNNS